MKNILFTIIVCIIIPINNLYSQAIAPSIINSAGGSKKIGTNTYEWNIGEMILVNTATTSTLTVTQGLLQPINNSTSKLENTILNSNQIQIYPNPTQNNIFIQPNIQTQAVMDCMIYDVIGRQIFTNTFLLNSGNELQQIEMINFASGSYLLHVKIKTNQNTFENTFKIIKN